MKARIVSSRAMFAADTFSAVDFIADPCANCQDGKGQHVRKKQPNGGVFQKDRGVGPCTRPGCKCKAYVDPAEVSYYGA